MQTAQSTQKASGTYYGIPFTGIVIRSRQHTCAPFAMLHTVRFDRPITTLGFMGSIDQAIIQDCYAKGDGIGCFVSVGSEQ